MNCEFEALHNVQALYQRPNVGNVGMMEGKGSLQKKKTAYFRNCSKFGTLKFRPFKYFITKPIPSSTALAWLYEFYQLRLKEMQLPFDFYVDLF